MMVGAGQPPRRRLDLEADLPQDDAQGPYIHIHIYIYVYIYIYICIEREGDR